MTTSILPPPQNTTRENLSFPPDLTSVTNNYMVFRFEKYRRRAINAPVERQTTGNAIRLPIPNNLKDAFSVNYSNENLGPIAGTVLEATVGALNGNVPTTFQEARNALLQAGQTAAEVATAVGLEALRAGAGAAAGRLPGVAGTVAQQTVSGLGSAASQLLGIGINPYITVMFKNPEYKEHAFDWRFVPRNAAESQLLVKIIKQFKRSMLPGVNSLTPNTNLLFDYPDVLAISINPDNEYMYKFKTCVLKSLVVNYTPASTPAFFKDTNAPAAITMSMQIGEIEYWTQRDFPN